MIKFVLRFSALVGSLVRMRPDRSPPPNAVALEETAVSEADSGHMVVATFVRGKSVTDDELAARHLGRVEVALRWIDRRKQ